MPKKEWTPEERKAFGDKMRALKAQKKTEATDTVLKTPEEVNLPKVEPVQPADYDANDVAAMMRYIKELESQNWRQNQSQHGQQGPQVINNKMTGTVEKYPINRKLYSDPVERLSNEPRLQPMAFKYNYELEFEIGTTTYTTIDNIRMQEPKFTLRLIRIMLDEVTGEPTNGRYVVCQMIFHEDPDTAVLLANQNGIDVDETNESQFLDEMRYLRMRDWLLECFYPAPIKDVSNRKTVAIDGKLVEYYEVNSERPAAIPFSNLKRA